MFTCENGRCINKVNKKLENLTMFIVVHNKKNVFFRVGFVIMIMIAVMEVMKANSVIHNIKHARHKSLHAKTSNAFVHNIVVMVKMTAVIIQMKLVARRKKILHV